ncbi:PAS domain-containing sensor histidine kinase [Sphingomonas glacialis]|uniref:PAS domain-containing sensor histidine kinase n=1 Tax=Sphingomonas glacialis TaxID=658225 RepID=UPI001386B448|nr:PAS domain-containing protein [Sphingomonas glacialis]
MTDQAERSAALEELYRFTMRINRQIPFVADAGGAVLCIDPLWGEWAGAAPSEALGFGFLHYIHHDDRSMVKVAWIDAMAHADAFLLDHRARMADGSYRWFRCASEKYQLPGEPLRWRGLLTDIDELCRARTAAQDSEARFRTAAFATRDVIWDLDLATSTVTFSECLATALGYDASHTSAASWWRKQVHPDDIDRVTQAFRACPPGERWICDYRMRRADGSYMPMQARAFILRDAHGRPVRVTGALTDLTEERATKRRIERLQSEMADSSRSGAAAAFAMLSHELNQPPTALANFVRGARRLLEQDDPTARDRVLMAMDAAAASASDAGAIVHRLSDLVSHGEGRLSAQNLWEAANDARALTCLDTAGGGVRIEIAGDLGDLEVIGDRLQIRQVFLNLFRNAVEALIDTPDPRVSVSVAPAGEFVRVAVIDNGPGFGANKPEALFAPFTTTKANGVGLGLSICQMIIEANGGEIRAEPHPVGGAAFYFTVPQTEGRSDADASIG